jgi:hypothetical protein
MENLKEKEEFLKMEYLPLLKSLDAETRGSWGKMSVQQMVEHMSDYVRISSGKNPQKTITPEEHLERMKTFMKSEKPFRENTPNSLLPDDPPPVKHPDLQEACAELKQEIDDFFSAFENNKDLQTTHPFFGELNFEENIHLLHKHALHHLRQFGLQV